MVTGAVLKGTCVFDSKEITIKLFLDKGSIERPETGFTSKTDPSDLRITSGVLFDRSIVKSEKCVLNKNLENDEDETKYDHG